MESFTFAVVVENFDPTSDEQAEQLDWELADIYASQIDDFVYLTISSVGQVDDRIDFAIDAILFLRRISPSIEVTSVVQDLVGATDIAVRSGFDRETVRTWATASRGPGDFPMPVARLNGGRKIWDWPSVSDWLKKNNLFSSNESGLTRKEFARLDALVRSSSWEAARSETKISYLPQVFTLNIPELMGSLPGGFSREWVQILSAWKTSESMFKSFPSPSIEGKLLPEVQIHLSKYRFKDADDEEIVSRRK